MTDAAPTPMMAQYLSLKAEAQDCLLFYRMGDFFEMFFEDAKIAAACLDIALTARGEHGGVAIPMCGVPVHAAEGYLARLIKAGHRVAIAEQTGFHGRYVALMQAVAEAASASYGKPLPINATGAIGALCCEMGLSWKVSHGLGVMARAVGLVGHILEEARQPMAMELWHRAEDEATAHSRGKLRNIDTPKA